MCSEANPFDCHGFALISYQIIKEGGEYVLKGGNFKENENLESQFIEKYEKMPKKVYLKRSQEMKKLRGLTTFEVKT